MSGLLQDELLTNPATDLPWKKSTTTKMLELYLDGAHPKRIAQELGRNPKAVLRRLEQLTYNERGMAEVYSPFNRVSRKGKRMTENDRVLIAAHKKYKVPIEATARLLARSVDELRGDAPTQKAKVRSNQVLAPTLDLVLALRYAYHIKKVSVVADAVYDDLVSEEIEYGGAAKQLSDQASASNVPRRIVFLANYLCEKHLDEREGKE